MSSSNFVHHYLLYVLNILEEKGVRRPLPRQMGRDRRRVRHILGEPLKISIPLPCRSSLLAQDPAVMMGNETRPRGIHNALSLLFRSY